MRYIFMYYIMQERVVLADQFQRFGNTFYVFHFSCRGSGCIPVVCLVEVVCLEEVVCCTLVCRKVRSEAQPCKFWHFHCPLPLILLAVVSPSAESSLSGIVPLHISLMQALQGRQLYRIHRIYRIYR